MYPHVQLTDDAAMWISLVCLALVLPAAAVAQTTDTVVVTLLENGAEVRQRLVPTEELVQAYAIRFDDQHLELTEVINGEHNPLSATLTSNDGRYELNFESGTPIIVRFSLTGSVERIPLFVTGGRAELTVVREIETPYLIRIEGLGDRLSVIDLSTSLPRFILTESGNLEVELSSIPALLRLADRGAFTFSRIADLIALVLIILGASYALRSGRVRRPESVRTS